MRTHGSSATDFIDVGALFERLLAERPERGAAVCAYLDGERVVDLWGGAAYDADSMQLLFSVTKGLTSMVVARLVSRGILAFDERVATYWPEFATWGKERTSVGDLMAHRAGLPAPVSHFTIAEWADGTVADALARQRPMWEPGSAHGYHALTFGVLAGALVAKVTGRTVGAVLREEISEPLEADAVIGTDAECERRIVPVAQHECASSPPNSGPLREAADEYRPQALDDFDVWNEAYLHQLELPAVNGVASARALAKIYAACIGSVEGAEPLFERGILDQAVRSRSFGPDLILGSTTHFGAGFQLPTSLWPMTGNAGAFGHDGFGGSVAFADAELGLAVAFTTDRAPAIGGIDLAAQLLIASVVAATRRRNRV